MATAKSYTSVDSKEQLILVQTGEEEFGAYKQHLLVNSLSLEIALLIRGC